MIVTRFRRTESDEPTSGVWGELALRAVGSSATLGAARHAVLTGPSGPVHNRAHVVLTPPLHDLRAFSDVVVCVTFLRTARAGRSPARVVLSTGSDLHLTTVATRGPAGACTASTDLRTQPAVADVEPGPSRLTVEIARLGRPFITVELRYAGAAATRRDRTEDVLATQARHWVTHDWLGGAVRRSSWQHCMWQSAQVQTEPVPPGRGLASVVAARFGGATNTVQQKWAQAIRNLCLELHAATSFDGHPDPHGLAEATGVFQSLAVPGLDFEEHVLGLAKPPAREEQVRALLGWLRPQDFPGFVDPTA